MHHTEQQLHSKCIIQNSNCTPEHLFQRNEDMFTYEHKESNVFMLFILALFIIAKNCTHSKYFSVNEWLYKLIQPYHGILFDNKKAVEWSITDTGNKVCASFSNYSN